MPSPDDATGSDEHEQPPTFADLGTTEKEFTQAWRAYLRELA